MSVGNRLECVGIVWMLMASRLTWRAGTVGEKPAERLGSWFLNELKGTKTSLKSCGVDDEDATRRVFALAWEP
jgi:hypothetical protein